MTEKKARRENAGKTFSTFEQFRMIYKSFDTCEERDLWIENLSFDQMKIANSGGWSVATELSMDMLLPEKFMTPEILSLADHHGSTPARWLAQRRALPDRCVTEEILKLTYYTGETVACEMAVRGDLPKRFLVPEILSLSDGYYCYTVAAALAEHGFLPWELLSPELICAKGVDETVAKNCHKTKGIILEVLRKEPREMLDSILARIPMESLVLLADDAEEGLKLAILKRIDRETESGIFEHPDNSEPDGGNADTVPLGGLDPLYSGRDELYEAGRG